MTQYCQINQNGANQIYGTTTRLGSFFDTDAAGNADTIEQATIPLKTSDAGESFTIYLRIYSTANALMGTIGEINNTSLTGSYQDIVFDTTPVTMPAAGGYLVIECSPTGTARVNLQTNSTGAVSDTWFDDTQLAEYGGSWSHQTPAWAYCVTITAQTPTGTLLPPPYANIGLSGL